MGRPKSKMEMPVWQKPTSCPPFGCCVEVQIGKIVKIRQAGKNRSVLFRRDEWEQFITAIKNGEFD